MTWRLEFHPKALREARKLDHELRLQVLARLETRLSDPLVPKARLRGNPPNCFKIKFKKAGWRLVYQVNLESNALRVLAIGRRDGDVYREAAARGASDS